MSQQQKPAVFYCNAALFDCDGTLVNSTGAISEFWRDFGKTRPHVNPEEIIRTSHGCRTFDVIAKWSPEDAIVEQVTEWEGAIPDTFGEFAKPIPGAVDLVRQFEDYSKNKTEDGRQRWTIVTSGTLPLASKWLKLLGIPQPAHFITAEGVTKGKPDPEGYAKARSNLGFPQGKGKVVVFEDAPAGISAGKGAGAFVVGICSTYDPKKVQESGADIVVDDLSSLKIVSYDVETELFKVEVGKYHFAQPEFLQ